MAEEDRFSSSRVVRRITSRDVALEAGVSQATVSNVLNRPDLVAPATRERVRQVIDRLGFVINDGARSLRAGRSSTLAVSVLDVGNPFWGEVTRAIADHAAERGYVMALGSTDESLARERDYLNLFEEQRVASVMAAPVDRELGRFRRLVQMGIPVVLLDARDPRGRLPFVAVDDIRGGMLAGEHLLGLGHRRIACVNGPSERPWSADRWAGMRKAVVAKGLDPERVLVREPVQTLTASEGLRAVDQLCQRQDPATAIFCDNDLLALGALHALERRGIRVPDDISLVGYDDDDFAEMVTPPLTTIRQEPYRLGHAAAELAVRAIEGLLDAKSLGHTFVPSLVERRSTTKARDR